MPQLAVNVMTPVIQRELSEFTLFSPAFSHIQASCPSSADTIPCTVSCFYFILLFALLRYQFFRSPMACRWLLIRLRKHLTLNRQAIWSCKPFHSLCAFARWKLESNFRLWLNFGLLVPSQYGHKLFLQIGLILFGTCSLACSLSHNFIQLATFRALQGLASAAMAPSLLGILGRTFEMGDKLRTVAFSAFAAGAPLGAAIGLIAGGFITQGTKTTWRSVGQTFLSII